MPKKNTSAALRLRDFDYDLPQGLIAQTPAKPRESARLMTVNKATGEISHRRFFDLPALLESGDVLVFNDSKVIPARLNGKKETGGRVEVFLLNEEKGKGVSKKNNENIWQCLIKGKVKAGQKIFLTAKIIAEPMKKIDEKIWLVRFNALNDKIFSLGETPLPPYIKQKSKSSDYQNVYAKVSGSVAAPTAGLHFSKKLLAQLKKRGIKIEFVTLHVGLGTFMSVETENILEHKMHAELAEIDALTAKRLNGYKKEGRRIIAVGTTAVRTLESFADSKGKIIPQKKSTDIFIYPGYKFRFVDAIITNFHLPKSTLLMLISAFAGQDLIKRAYQEAIAKKYRFFSFGDGMFLK